MKCPRCQQDNPAQARFCMACGAGLSARSQRGKVGSVAASRRKRPQSEGPQIPDLEKRLAEALHREAEALNREADAQEQQAATAKILQVISQSPTDVTPIFDTIVESAWRLCAATRAAVYRFDGRLVHFVAHHGYSAEALAIARALSPSPPDRSRVATRAIVDRTVVHIPDVFEDTEHRQPDLARAVGVRSLLGVPMLRDGEPLGAVFVGREDPGPFSRDQIELLKTFADQAVIGIENVRLFTELQEKNRALTQAHAQVTESLERQTATSEILRVISSAHTDAQPVFDTIVQSAVRLCKATGAAVFLTDGRMLYEPANYGGSAEALAASRARYPRPLDMDTTAGIAILTRSVIHVSDTEDPSATEWMRQSGRLVGFRSVVTVPMLRDADAAGAILVTRRHPGPFSDTEVELLKTFTDQAVIAIENVRLFKELEARNRDLTESLEQQTATSEVLKVISRSAFDLQPVLQTLVDNATRLCGAESGVIWRFDGEVFRLAAERGVSPELKDSWARYPFGLGRGSATGRTALERRTVHIADVLADPEYTLSDAQKAGGFRTILGVPMLRDGVLVGVFGLQRYEVRPFTDRQIELVTTFADQAAIAIENVRLFTELEEKNRALTDAHAQVTETLEQQTATGEILRVIASSPTDVQPVFDTIVASAVRLLEADSGLLTRIAGDQIEIAALTSTDPAGDAILRAAYPVSRHSDRVHARVIRDRAPLNVADAQTDPRLPDVQHATARARGYRSHVAVPLLRHDDALGAIAVTRHAPGGFTDDEIALLQTFADQAVIAIENVRLFNETKEALDRQTATAEILRVIASSPTELQPVLNAVAESAARVCAAEDAVVMRVEIDTVRPVAYFGTIPPSANFVGGRRLSPRYVVGRAILDRRTIHIANLDELVEEYPEANREFPTILAAPMVREGAAVGAIVMRRRQVKPFTDKQIALLQTFADQAVIAIENVRLFKELQERNTDLSEALDKQTATSEILRAISNSPTDEQAVFDAIVRSAVRLCHAAIAGVFRTDGKLVYHPANYGGTPEALAEIRARYPRPLDMTTSPGIAILTRSIVHVPDIEDPSAVDFVRQAGRVIGFRGIVTVPMLRESEVVGAIVVGRREPGRFSDAEVEILKTFADQAVIAIENVRLFTELEEKNRALTEALEQQTATSEILRVISQSPTDAQPVFDAIARSAMRLCESTIGVISRYDGELLHLAAHSHQDSPAALEMVQQIFPARPSRAMLHGRVVLERAVVHLPDVFADSEFRHSIAVAFRARSALGVPMLLEGRVVGVIAVARVELRPFTDSDIALLKTFADQAVIAIENVRLFKELQASNKHLTEALDTQTATSDILRVISRSQTDVQPVFEEIVSSAIRLMGAQAGALTRITGDHLHLAAFKGTDKSGESTLRAAFPLSLQIDGAHANAVRNRTPVNIAEAQTETGVRARSIARAVGYQSMVVVPMLHHEVAVGTISAVRREAGGFTDDEITLLQTFADQAVIAIENARLLSELQARTKELTHSVDQLTALGEVGRAVGSSLDLDTVLSTIVGRAVELSGTDGGTIFEYDESAEEFTARATLSADESQSALLRATRLRRGEGAVGQMAVTHQPIQILDIAAEGAYESRIRDAMLVAGTRSVLAVPLLHEEQLVGGLVVTRRVPGAFTAEVIELLRTFATQSALAIQNARLFRELADKSRQLEVASQHKSEFLANMSHELRTPLNAVIGFSEVLSERMFGDLNEKQDEYLKDIHASGQHLLSLINDILDLSKIEAGKMELELSELDLPMTIDNALMLVRERAMRRSIDLHTTVDKGLGQIQADERKIRQVLLNLLSNAIKFTPEGGRIDVEAKPVHGSVEVSVSDTGVGIAPEDQEAVFEEFRQVGTADKKIEGTGLGLALSRKFIELHGGKIWVKSQVGAGSTFTFTIPVRRG